MAKMSWLRTRSRCRWMEGEIAYLTIHTNFSLVDKLTLIDSHYLERGVTGHPSIILKCLKTGNFVITPVSSHSWGGVRGFLPPWRTPTHNRTSPLNFRSFEGSERASEQYDVLRLQGGRWMPKPQASWVNVQSEWEVPGTVLAAFNKVKKGTMLRLTEDSLEDLRQHIAQDCRRHCDSWEFELGCSSMHLDNGRSSNAGRGRYADWCPPQKDNHTLSDKTSNAWRENRGGPSELKENDNTPVDSCSNDGRENREGWCALKENNDTPSDKSSNTRRDGRENHENWCVLKKKRNNNNVTPIAAAAPTTNHNINTDAVDTDKRKTKPNIKPKAEPKTATTNITTITSTVTYATITAKSPSAPLKKPEPGTASPQQTWAQIVR